MADNLIRQSQDIFDLSTSKTFKERLRIFFQRLPRELVTPGREENLVIHLPHAHLMETFEAAKSITTAVEEAIGNSQGISYTGPYVPKTIKIPASLAESLIERIDEKAAEKIIKALAPMAQLYISSDFYMNALADITGNSPPSDKNIHPRLELIRTQYGDGRYGLDKPPVYEINFTGWKEDRIGGLTDPIRHIAGALNHALGQNLFEGVAHQGGFMLLHIPEADMPALLQNPNLAAVKAIFDNPRAESEKYLDQGRGGNLRRLARTILPYKKPTETHTQRLENPEAPGRNITGGR